MSNGGTSTSGATPDDFDDHGDTVTVFQHEGDGENTEHLQSMDLHDVKTALEKDAELDEPGSAGKAATSPTSAAGSASLQQTTIRPIIQPMLYANGFMVPPFAAGTSIFSAGIRPIKMEGSEWKVSQAPTVTGIPYGYPTAGFLPVDQSGFRPAAGYPFMIPGQYAVATPYQQFTTFGQPVAPNAAVQPNSGLVQPQVKEKKPHIKKPLNAFMIFMKTKRAEVIKECTLKESAAINQILGKMWHALDRSEQATYYEMAREERARHMQMYPGWSARDNYAVHKKRRKRKAKSEKGNDEVEGSTDSCALGENEGERCPDKHPDNSESFEGSTDSCALGESEGERCPDKHPDNSSNWCAPCRRKRKCVKRNNDDELDISDFTKNGKVAITLQTIPT
ncbi:transcription factor 7-like 2 isoform X1 [Halichondria panicea]|uniref:transcription factor 7-like 2 isoform X1 n=1 Tax=Halichondria panicea TaxID=6063 RepID=UPI00312B2E51